MGRHGVACTSSDPEFNSGSDDAHNVPWGPQKHFLEDFCSIKKKRKNRICITDSVTYIYIYIYRYIYIYKCIFT